MGGEGEAAAASDPTAAATVHVRCSNGTKFSVSVLLDSSVSAFKELLVQPSDVPADQQRLIYKGRVLKDDNSLESYGLQTDHTVHLVRGAPSSTASTPTVTATPTVAPTAAIGAPTVNGPAGLASLPEFQQVQQQLMQNPNLMREMMNMPAVQSLMNNPDLMRTLIMNNPQMREIIDRNPDLAHILNDPATLRQTLDAARNPELMREMMRNTDRAMSNIEASPEGFNMLRRMYETVQEPLLNAATEGGTDARANPFAALLGRQGATNEQVAGSGDAAGGETETRTGGAVTGTGTGTTVGAGATTVFPNTAPLPNPWNPTPRAGEVAGQGMAGAIPGLGMGGLGGLGGLALPDIGGLGLADMQQMLQNPAIMQSMQTLLSNPNYLNQIMNMQPMLNANPQFREMMQNPDFVRQMTSPESLQQMAALQQTLMGQLGRQQPGQTGQAGAGVGAGLDLNSLFGGIGVPQPQVSAAAAEELYATQLLQLQDMGFFDTQENIRALIATGGNVHAAVDRLLGNSA